ncbi:MAG: STAS domain-containing protein [Rubrobacter sp.]|nr:STAS domain-containing protein [Rubrobacter sp.]
MSTHEIRLIRLDGRGFVVELRGEFDLHNLEELRTLLDRVLGLRVPTFVDLSGVTFVDFHVLQELTTYHLLYAHHLSLCNPSWQVTRSVEASWLSEWIRFDSHPGPGVSAVPNEPPARAAAAS